MAKSTMIIIIGDSWGVGEFDRQCNLSGPGFGQYLMLHDRVVNLSVAAASNTLSLNRLTDFLEHYKLQFWDNIFWVVTCPTRCSDGARNFLQPNLSILDTAKKLLYQSLDIANVLANLHQTKIQLIGGLCDLDWLVMDRWNSLDVRVPSWSKLVNPGCPQGIIFPSWWTEFGQIVKEQFPDHMLEWLEISDQILGRQESWKKNFLTDGCHPDRNGHRLLRDHLYPEWSHKI